MSGESRQICRSVTCIKGHSLSSPWPPRRVSKVLGTAVVVKSNWQWHFWQLLDGFYQNRRWTEKIANANLAERWTCGFDQIFWTRKFLFINKMDLSIYNEFFLVFWNLVHGVPIWKYWNICRTGGKCDRVYLVLVFLIRWARKKFYSCQWIFLIPIKKNMSIKTIKLVRVYWWSWL